MSSPGTPRRDGRSEMTEVVDPRRGSVRVSGTLTAQGADLLRGTVECLRRGGHERVLLDLADVTTVESAGLQELRALEDAVTEDGGELLLLGSPTIPAPHG